MVAGTAQRAGRLR